MLKSKAVLNKNTILPYLKNLPLWLRKFYEIVMFAKYKHKPITTGRLFHMTKKNTNN
jgi:hypothetical protein